MRHKFTGKEMDAGSGLYYFGARYYDPILGRFISADPTIQNPYDPQDLNRYTYCRNNPLKYTDPTGLGWKSFLGKIIAFIAAVITFILTAGNIAAAFFVFNIVDTVISSAQAIYYGADPGKVLGSLAMSLVLSAVPASSATNLLVRAGINAFRGAAISAAVTAAFGGDVGKSAAMGAGAAVVSTVAGALTENSNTANSQAKQNEQMQKGIAKDTTDGKMQGVSTKTIAAQEGAGVSPSPGQITDALNKASAVRPIATVVAAVVGAVVAGVASDWDPRWMAGGAVLGGVFGYSTSGVNFSAAVQGHYLGEQKSTLGIFGEIFRGEAKYSWDVDIKWTVKVYGMNVREGSVPITYHPD